MTPKQQRFIEEYLIDLNATQAAIRAGYSAKTAYSIGQQNLNKIEIASALKEANAERSAQTKIDAQWVLEAAADLYRRCVADKDKTNERHALALIGKHIDVAAFEERIRQDGTLTVKPTSVSDLLADIGESARQGDASIH